MWAVFTYTLMYCTINKLGGKYRFAQSHFDSRITHVMNNHNLRN